MMRDILKKLGQLEETAPKAKKILTEDSTTPSSNVSDKPASLKDMFEMLSENVAPGQKPLPVLDPQKKQAGMGFVTSDNPSVQNILKNLDPKDVQIVQAPGQQPMNQQQPGQSNQAGATGQTMQQGQQQGQQVMREVDSPVKARYTVKPSKYSTRGKFMVRDLKDHSAVGVYQTEEEALAAAEKLNKEREHRLMWGRNDDRAPTNEGAKVDRMVKHIAKSEREAGKSKDKAEDIAWATANKRGYLDNKNKKKTNESSETEYKVLGQYDAKTSKGYDTRPVSVKVKAASEKEAKELAKEKLAHNHKNYRPTKVETLSKKVEEADIPSSQGIDTRGAGLGAGRSATTLEGKKPDFLDLDKDGNKKEPMKKAAADKKKQKVKESMNHRISAARLEGKSHGLKGHAHCGKNFEDLEERKAYCEGYKDGLDECYGMGVYEAAPAMPAATVGGMAHDEMGEGNAFTAGLARTPRGGQFKVGGKTFTDRTGYDSPLGETDYAFEAWDRELNSLLTENETVSEGLSVSITKGQQNAPDSVTITGQDAEADQLLALVKQAGLGLFGGEEEPSQSSAMSIQPVDGEPTEIGAGSTDLEVVDGSDGMLALMKKLGGIQGDESDEEESEEEHTCNECGMMEASCCCNKEKVEEEETEDQMEFEVSENAPDSGAEDSIADEEAEAGEDADLAGADSDDEEEMNESFFDLLGRLSKLTESSDEEDEEDVTESEEDEEDVAEDLTEWANNAGKKGTDASFEQDIDFMTKVIAGGLNKPKSTGQTTVPVIAGQADRMQDHQGSVSDSVDDWKKLAGLK